MKRFAAFLVFIVLVATACIGPFYEDDYGENIAIPVGTPFEIRLEGDPGSNYAWNIKGLDTNVVRMVLRPVFKPHSAEDKVGGIYSFYFQTVGEGNTPIEMVYIKQDSIKSGEHVSRFFRMEVESKI